MKTAEDVVKEIAVLDDVLQKTSDGPEKDVLLAILKHLEVVADILPLRDEVNEPHENIRKVADVLDNSIEKLGA